MKTIRLTEHWQERDSGQGSVSNPSHHSNNNSTSNLHAQQISNMMPVSTSVTNVERAGANASNVAAVVVGGCPSVNNITVNQVAIHQQQSTNQHHEPGHDHLCNRKLTELIPTFNYLSCDFFFFTGSGVFPLPDFRSRSSLQSTRQQQQQLPLFNLFY